MYKLKLGVSVGLIYENTLNVNFEYQIKNLKSLGFDSVDLNLCGSNKPAVYEQVFNALPDLVKIIIDNGLYLNGVHLPFGAILDISSPDEELAKRSLDFAVKVVKEVDKYSPNCYVLHGSGDGVPNDLRASMLDRLINAVNLLASNTTCTVCVENLPRACLLNTVTEIKQALEKMPNVKICLDTNHFLTEKTEDAILSLGNVIKTTHISDHDYVNERHWLPTQGKIDWQKVIGALEKIGYDGVFNYELCPNYDYQQIKNNFEQLFYQYNKQ